MRSAQQILLSLSSQCTEVELEIYERNDLHTYLDIHVFIINFFKHAISTQFLCGQRKVEGVKRCPP